MEAAAEQKGDTLRILAVTVLTSLDKRDLEQMGIEDDVRTVVLRRAHQAVVAGCDGIIASGHEAGELREALGAGPLIVTPGIRPADNSSRDDQKRIVTPALAIERGADYLVVGRPIRTAPSPRAAAEAIQAEIAAALTGWLALVALAYLVRAIAQTIRMQTNVGAGLAEHDLRIQLHWQWCGRGGPGNSVGVDAAVAFAAIART